MRARAALCVALCAAALLGLCAPAFAEFGFKPGSVTTTFADPEGEAATQASSHPFALHTVLAVNTVIDGDTGKEVPDGGEVENLVIEMPPGFAGNPDAVPHCSNADFLDVKESASACPNATALGLARVTIGFGEPFENQYPVYNLVPPPGQAAKLGFIALAGIPVVIDVYLAQSPPYNVRAEVRKIAQSAYFYASDVELWANPAAESHDFQRGTCGFAELEPCPVDIPEKTFFTTPARCGEPLESEYSISPWGGEGEWVRERVEGETPVGCGKVGFGPEISAQPTTRSADTSSGLDFTISIDDPDLTSTSEAAIADSPIKEARVTLPAGVTANPSAANGLEGCSEAELAAASNSVQGCPAASKLGTVEVRTPLLEGKLLRGSVYLAEPRANPFSSLLALYMVISDPELGILIKLPGEIAPDPATGRLTTTFGAAPHEIPQVPFSDFRFRFREGARAPLVTPQACGTYEVRTEFVPWSDPSSTHVSTDTFTIDHGAGGGPCPAAAPFAPGFEAGTASNAGSTYSPFTMRLTRRDGEQDITRFSARLPRGVVGRIAGVPSCPQAAIEAAKSKSASAELASPSCPAASAIGTVWAGAGVGQVLTYVPGALYLAGPHGGAPLSVAAIVPAKAGPFDVGTVVVQEGLNLDPESAEVVVDAAASDPIPHILAGIPLRLRDLRISVDRPEFTLNATRCGEYSTAAQISGGGADPFSLADDPLLDASSPYRAASCGDLGFQPRLKLRFRGQAKRLGHPGVRAELTFPGARYGPGYANVGRAVVLLPKATFIENSHIPSPCTREEFAQERCPKESILGRARAFTPLLDDPLEGPVYFRSNGGARELPDLVADLRGQFRIVLEGYVDSRGGRTRTRFLGVPDAPVSKFVINLYAGKRSLLTNSADLCSNRLRAKVNLYGQNGKAQKSSPVMARSCGKKKNRKARRHVRR